MANRLIDKTSKEGDCFVWRGAKSHGYGYIGFAGKVLRVHRVAYTLFIGPIPKGLHIDHLCRNRLCWRPSHLEAVTQAENNIRERQQRQRPERCKRGHDYQEEGGPCSTCKRERGRQAAAAYRERQKQARHV